MISSKNEAFWIFTLLAISGGFFVPFLFYICKGFMTRLRKVLEGAAGYAEVFISWFLHYFNAFL